MSSNVIILGAGSSFQAGIPLMSGFVEKMWEFALKGKCEGKKLKEYDLEIFNKAIQIRNELDGYHGRATFDDRNIEDILSILSFNIIAGKKSDKNKLNFMIRAIARTIELTCNIPYNFRDNQIDSTGPYIYRNFWINLFEWAKKNHETPTIITFNYDLVLERALFQVLRNTIYGTQREEGFPFKGITINYHYKINSDLNYKVKYIEYYGKGTERITGTTFKPVDENKTGNFAQIDLLKLHGSLNFPKPRLTKTGKQPLTKMNDDPYILPPVFNKFSTNDPIEMWRVALQRLRNAKNIIFVGYSLPQTDIYMQYFLKSALGPNVNLNKIYVFDPVLFRDDNEAENMRYRFASCFSSQLKNRIFFRPYYIKNPDQYHLRGTFTHFVELISSEKNGVFF